MIFRIIPELKDTDGFDQKHPHHCYEVWEHTQLYIQYCDAYAHDQKHIAKRIEKLDEVKEKLEEKIKRNKEAKEER